MTIHNSDFHSYVHFESHLFGNGLYLTVTILVSKKTKHAKTTSWNPPKPHPGAGDRELDLDPGGKKASKTAENAREYGIARLGTSQKKNVIWDWVLRRWKLSLGGVHACVRVWREEGREGGREGGRERGREQETIGSRNKIVRDRGSYNSPSCVCVCLSVSLSFSLSYNSPSTRPVRAGESK